MEIEKVVVTNSLMAFENVNGNPHDDRVKGIITATYALANVVPL